MYSITGTLIVHQVEAGYRLPPPNHCPDPVYNIMQDCWQYDEDDRPTFADLHAKLRQAQTQIFNWEGSRVINWYYFWFFFTHTMCCCVVVLIDWITHTHTFYSFWIIFSVVASSFFIPRFFYSYWFCPFDIFQLLLPF